MKTETISRPYTPEEVRAKMLSHFKHLCKYWPQQTGAHNDTEEKRMQNLVFSILVTLDGGSCALPAFDLIPAPHESDKEYHIENGENYYEKEVINNCQLHEIWAQSYCSK
jgi:hypothetical protein